MAKNVPWGQTPWKQIPIISGMADFPQILCVFLYEVEINVISISEALRTGLAIGSTCYKDIRDY